MKILAVSDNRLPQLSNGEFLVRQYGEVRALVSCGDLDDDYLDFIASVLGTPLFYVRGNHDHSYNSERPGGVNLHRRIVSHNKYSFMGFEGSIRYNKANIQYSQSAMAGFVLQSMPTLLIRRIALGYGVDVVVAHSPPLNINDAQDYAHRGFRAFRWLIRWACPRYFIHGHVDIYDRRLERETQFFKTKVININPSMMLDLGQE